MTTIITQIVVSALKSGEIGAKVPIIIVNEGLDYESDNK
jgi:hypothetical protein